jgi:hypothetical protein
MQATRGKPHASGRAPHGDVTQRVGVEAITARGVEVDTLIEKFIDAAGAGESRALGGRSQFGRSPGVCSIVIT